MRITTATSTPPSTFSRSDVAVSLEESPTFPRKRQPMAEDGEDVIVKQQSSETSRFKSIPRRSIILIGRIPVIDFKNTYPAPRVQLSNRP